MARHFASERRWLAALQEYARQARDPLPALMARLGLEPQLVEGVDIVRTRTELEAHHG
jgi:hypothetical protein